MSATTCLAIDIGGTKLAVGLVSSEGRLLTRQQAPTTRGADAETLLGKVLALSEQACASAAQRPDVVGVGCGGPMDPLAGTVSPLNIPGWRAFPLVDRLHEALGLPVSLDNDAKALALAEGWLGAACHAESYLAMVVSTGVGGGIVLDGRLLDGRLGNAGHIGHLVVVPDGRLCTCGVHGCLEAEASGTAIQAITGRPAKEAPSAIIERTGQLVGRAVASVVTLLDLDLCVVAGSVALGFGQPFFDAAQRSLREHTGLDFTRGAAIVPAGLGDEGPLIGAAAVGFAPSRTLERA
jgi:glucokinase